MSKSELKRIAAMKGEAAPEFGNTENAGGVNNTFRVSLRRKFEPLPDITAYELALLLPYFQWKPLYAEDLKALGTAVRHLKE